jgi:mRNA interferase HigB
MRIIAWKNLLTYGERHPAAQAALRHWKSLTRDSQWRTMSEAADALSRAKSVAGDRIRYDLVGGDYRLIVAFDFEKQIAFVKFIGTHAEYDRIDAATVEMF